MSELVQQDLPRAEEELVNLFDCLLKSVRYVSIVIMHVVPLPIPQHTRPLTRIPSSSLPTNLTQGGPPRRREGADGGRADGVP